MIIYESFLEKTPLVRKLLGGASPPTPPPPLPTALKATNFSPDQYFYPTLFNPTNIFPDYCSNSPVQSVKHFNK